MQDSKPPLPPDEPDRWHEFARQIQCPFCGHEFMSTAVQPKLAYIAIFADCHECGGAVQWCYYKDTRNGG